MSTLFKKTALLLVTLLLLSGSLALFHGEHSDHAGSAEHSECGLCYFQGLSQSFNIAPSVLIHQSFILLAVVALITVCVVSPILVKRSQAPPLA